MLDGLSEHSLELVRDYYGRQLRSTADLQTTACCAVERLPSHITAIVDLIHPEIRGKFYGCGVIAPAGLTGKTVLDLGCGSGRDVYVLSKLVGPEGRVIGVDMTDEQLAVARRHQTQQAQAFGYKHSNVSFLTGYIEDLSSLDIASESIDVVVSNCVINLSPAKGLVFSEIFRVLKPGGELHFSDVFVDRRLPATLRSDPVLLGECLGGAMYIEDFRRMLQALGCPDVRCISRTPIGITDPSIAQKLGVARFSSQTLRAFKLDLEDRCEDYGQIASYLGTLPDAAHSYALDDHHEFVTGKPILVCSNTAKMLAETRLAPHFKVLGDLTTHYGLFPCGPAVVADAAATSTSGAACC